MCVCECVCVCVCVCVCGGKVHVCAAHCNNTCGWEWVWSVSQSSFIISTTCTVRIYDSATGLVQRPTREGWCLLG